ncbi:mitotic-spindle organizing protein 2A [Trichonephila clavipes]|nr:mitotic-spindle organizing protein 2A [Trichonephila clavipes]
MVAVLKESEPLGGEGKIVEIDESMFGKMKYGKGKNVNGQWVFGGVERNSNKCFFRVVPNRTKEEHLSVTKEWVIPGSIIISDCWKAYNCLSHEGYQHLRVNHSLTFKDPETGAHTNSIEGTWSVIKRSLRNVEGEFDHYLAEYMWRRRYFRDGKGKVFHRFRRHQFLNGKSEFLVYENENKIDGERQREGASAQNGWRRGTEADERRYPKKRKGRGIELSSTILTGYIEPVLIYSKYR